jgi:hypothetical protein
MVYHKRTKSPILAEPKQFIDAGEDFYEKRYRRNRAKNGTKNSRNEMQTSFNNRRTKTA